MHVLSSEERHTYQGSNNVLNFKLIKGKLLLNFLNNHGRFAFFNSKFLLSLLHDTKILHNPGSDRQTYIPQISSNFTINYF